MLRNGGQSGALLWFLGEYGTQQLPRKGRHKGLKTGRRRGRCRCVFVWSSIRAAVPNVTLGHTRIDSRQRGMRGNYTVFGRRAIGGSRKVERLLTHCGLNDCRRQQ